MDCPTCKGRGEVRQFDPATRARWFIACPDCLGTGKNLSQAQKDWRMFIRNPERWLPAVCLVVFFFALFGLVTYLLDKHRSDPNAADPVVPALRR